MQHTDLIDNNVQRKNALNLSCPRCNDNNRRKIEKALKKGEKIFREASMMVHWGYTLGYEGYPGKQIVVCPRCKLKQVPVMSEKLIDFCLNGG